METLLQPHLAEITEQLEQWIATRQRFRMLRLSGAAPPSEEIRINVAFDFMDLLERDPSVAHIFAQRPREVAQLCQEFLAGVIECGLPLGEFSGHEVIRQAMRHGQHRLKVVLRPTNMCGQPQLSARADGLLTWFDGLLVAAGPAQEEGDSMEGAEDGVGDRQPHETLGCLRQTLIVVPFAGPSGIAGHHRTLAQTRTIHVSIDSEDLVQTLEPGQLVRCIGQAHLWIPALSSLKPVVKQTSDGKKADAKPPPQLFGRMWLNASNVIPLNSSARRVPAVGWPLGLGAETPGNTAAAAEGYRGLHLGDWSGTARLLDEIGIEAAVPPQSLRNLKLNVMLSLCCRSIPESETFDWLSDGDAGSHTAVPSLASLATTAIPEFDEQHCVDRLNLAVCSDSELASRFLRLAIRWSARYTEFNFAHARASAWPVLGDDGQAVLHHIFDARIRERSARVVTKLQHRQNRTVWSLLHGANSLRRSPQAPGMPLLQSDAAGDEDARAQGIPATELNLIRAGGPAGEQADQLESQALLDWEDSETKAPARPNYGSVFERCRRVDPVLSPEASGLLRRFFHSCRQVHRYPSLWILEALRVAKSHARLNLRPTVTVMDVLVAIMVLEETRVAQGRVSALQFGLQTHSGRLNLDVTPGETEWSRLKAVYRRVLQYIGQSGPEDLRAGVWPEACGMAPDGPSEFGDPFPWHLLEEHPGTGRNRGSHPRRDRGPALPLPGEEEKEAGAANDDDDVEPGLGPEDAWRDALDPGCHGIQRACDEDRGSGGEEEYGAFARTTQRTFGTPVRGFIPGGKSRLPAAAAAACVQASPGSLPLGQQDAWNPDKENMPQNHVNPNAAEWRR